MTPPENTTNSLDWTIDRKRAAKSIFLKKKMREHTNYKKVVGFIHSGDGINYVGNARFGFLVKESINDEISHMQTYQNLYSTRDKCFHTSYRLTKHKWGRIIPNSYASASVLRRGIRHAICEEYYKDIDMVCCHPKIVYEICKLNGIADSVTALRDYTTDPKQYRQQIMETHGVDYDTAKQLPNRIMFGGTYDSWKRENGIKDKTKMAIIIQLETQVKFIIELVYARNPQIKKDVLKIDPNRWKDEDETKRGVMGLWGQTIERIVQETAISYLVETQGFCLENIVSCQDGFMIQNRLYYDGILDDIEQSIMDAFGIEMKFVNKPFDEAIEIEEYNGGKSIAEWTDLITVKPLSQRLIHHFKDYIMLNADSGQLFVYYNSRWYNESDSKKQLRIIRYISEDLFEIMKDEIMSDCGLKVEERDIILSSLRSNTSTNARMNEIILHAKSIIKPSNQEFDSNPFLLGFDNGVFDLRQHIFRPYEYDDYMTMTTGYDFNPNLDIEHLDEEDAKIKNTLDDFFDSIQPNSEDARLLFQILASGLDGVAYQKVFFYNGRGGNGKGAIGSLMNVILGQYYGQPANGILYDIERAGVATPELMKLKGKRYINFKEVEGVLKASVVRNLTGGGKFEARNLNSGLVEFKMSSTFVMEFNNHPDLSGKPQESDYRRMVDFQFPTIFTHDANKFGVTIGENTYQKANDYFTSEEFVNKSRDVFLHMLLKTYKTYNGQYGIPFDVPERVISRTDEYLKNQNVFYSIFFKYWERCEVRCENGKVDKEDKKNKTITCKQLWTHVQSDEDYKILGARAKKNMYSQRAFYTWLAENFNVTKNSHDTKEIVGLVCIKEGEE